MRMIILNLDKTLVLEAANKVFANNYVELDECDLYLDAIEQGEIQIEEIDHPLYVSTHYVYEDHLVKNNKTRYKIQLTLLYVKKDPYEVLYDSYGKCYVAYENEGIHFTLYEDFQELLAPFIHKI